MARSKISEETEEEEEEEDDDTTDAAAADVDDDDDDDSHDKDSMKEVMSITKSYLSIFPPLTQSCAT